MGRLLLLASLLLAGIAKAFGAEPRPTRFCPCADERYVALNERGRAAAEYRELRKQYRAARIQSDLLEAGIYFAILARESGAISRDFPDARRDARDLEARHRRAQQRALAAGAIVLVPDEDGGDPELRYTLLEGRDYRLGRRR